MSEDILWFVFTVYSGHVEPIAVVVAALLIIILVYLRCIYIRYQRGHQVPPSLYLSLF